MSVVKELLRGEQNGSISFGDYTLDKKAKLDNFIQEGDVVQSFTFIVYSADGSSSLGDFKGGYGVSV